MEVIRDELVLLRASLVEDEFEWHSTMSASQIADWESAIDGNDDIIPVLPPPDFALLLHEGVSLHVQYHPNTNDVPVCTIQGPTLPREYAAELIREVVEGEQLFHQEEEYPLFNLFTRLVEWIAVHPIPPPPSSITPTARMHRNAIHEELRIKHVLLWSHHLLAQSKRRDILSWSRELELYGVSKPGYPGVIFVQGISTEVDEFVHRIKQLNWKALQVRSESSGPLLHPPLDVDPAERRKWAMRSTSFGASMEGRYGVREVEGMSEVGTLMRDAGLEEVFFTALKISK